MKAPLSKSGVPETVSEVRILPPPPCFSIFFIMPITPNTIAFAILGILLLVFIGQNMMLRRKLKSIFQGGGNANLEKTLELQIQKTSALEQESRKQNEHIGRVETQLQKALQKVAVTRFNSFDESSANQSFSIAALDGNKNGFVLTNLQMREGTRIYAKSVEKGIPKHKLSEEEEQAVNQALAQ